MQDVVETRAIQKNVVGLAKLVERPDIGRQAVVTDVAQIMPGTGFVGDLQAPLLQGIEMLVDSLCGLVEGGHRQTPDAKNPSECASLRGMTGMLLRIIGM